MKKFFFLTAIYFAGLTIAFAQQSAATNAIQKIINEKVRLHKNEEKDIDKPQRRMESASQPSDYPVSSSAEVESEIHAAINPLDSTNMICSSNTTTGGLAADIPLNHIYYTNNFGTSWQLSSFQPLPDTSGVFILGGGDPVFAYDKNGRVYYAWISLYSADFTTIDWDLLWAYSDDGGITFHRGSIPTIQHADGPIGALSDPTLFQGPISDKEWLAVDVSNSAYQNTLYCAYFEGNGQAQTQNIVVRRKMPANNFFTQSSVPVAGAGFQMIQFAGIDVDDQGMVHVSFFASADNMNFFLYHSMSTDGGVTFSAPNVVSEIQSYNFSPGLVGVTIPGVNVDRVYPCASLAADKTTGTPTSGNLYMTWTAAGITVPLSQGADIYFSKSVDHGNNWSPAVPLNSNATSDGTHQFYSSINVSPAGTVIIDWYDSRNFANANAQYYMAYSTDGGQTFGNDFSITSMETDFSTIGLQNQDFGVGEYNAVVSTSNTIIPFWTDGRTNDGDLNIFSARVDLDTLFASVISISDINSNFSLSSPFPNPASDHVSFVANSDGKETVKIYLADMTGRMVEEIYNGVLPGNKRMEVSLVHYSSGNYFIVMKGNSGVRKIKVTKRS